MKSTLSLQTIVGSLVVTAMLMTPALAKKKHAHPAAPAPVAASVSPQDPAAQTAASVASEQPVTLPLVLGELPWIKRCLDPQAPDNCIVDGGFALDHGLPPTMEVSVVTGTNTGTHPVTVLVPLDLRLQTGFALTIEGGTDAFIGTYSTCRAVGCYGQVVLNDAAYNTFLKARSIGVIVSNMSGRSVQLTAPLEGMEQVIAAPGMTPDEVAKARESARARLVAAGQAREDAAKARLAAVEKAKQDTPSQSDTEPAKPDNPAASAAAAKP